MKYRNAAERLPPQLVRELQQHAPGELLYIPKTQRKPWGEGTGARTLYAKRNAEIRAQHRSGQGIPALCDAHFLSDETVRKIIYTKGETAMNTNEIDYSKYFWQNDLVRIRRARMDDWKFNDQPHDSQRDFFTDYEQKLPTDNTLWQETWENYIKSNWDSETWICLTFETHDGEFVGNGNIHGIDQRNGTFGMFLGAKEERYAIAAARLMLDYAFNERRLHRCHTGFIAEDTVNIQLFEQLGFQKEGTRREQVFHRGRYWDEVLYGLLAEEFNAQK